MVIKKSMHKNHSGNYNYRRTSIRISRAKLSGILVMVILLCLQNNMLVKAETINDIEIESGEVPTQQELQDNYTVSTGNFTTTAYCPCKKCSGNYSGITASGKECKANHTVAAGKQYPFGTIIYIPELADTESGGWYEVEDRGGAVSNSKLDLYFNTHAEAVEYGKKELTVYVYLPN